MSTTACQVSWNSCTGCRKQHKKCDRQLPKCTLCTERNKECEYPTTNKRGPKGKSEYYRPYPEIKITKTKHINISPTVPIPIHQQPNIFDSFRSAIVEFIVFDFPTLPQGDLLKSIDYIESLELYSTEIFIDLDEEILALTYAIMSFLSRNWGYFEHSKSYYEKSRKLVGNLFDRTLQSSILATTYLFLGLYAISDDQSDKAKFYFSSVWNYLQANRNIQEDGNWMNSKVNSYSYYRFLEQMYYQCSAGLHPSLDLNLMFKGSIYKMHNLQRFYKHKLEKDPKPLAQPISTLVLANENCISPDELQRAHFDLETNDNSHFPVTIALVDKLQGQISHILDQMIGCLAESDIQIRRLTNLLFYQGMRLQIHMQDGDYDAIRRVSDSIASLTRTPYFKYLPAGISFVLSLVVQAHSGLFQKSNDQNDRSLLYERLHEDYQALMEVSQKHKYIARVNSVQIRCCEEIFRGLQAEQLRRTLIPSSILFANRSITIREYQEEIDSVVLENFAQVDDSFYEDLDQLLDQNFGC